MSLGNQSLRPIYQIGYICENLEASIRHQIDILGTGPWYVAESFKMPVQRYRGRDTPDLDIAVAFSFLGDMMYELIVQNDAGPSVYRDTAGERGYGLHHIAYFTKDFDKECRRLLDLGHDRAFEVTTGTDLGCKRVTYFDTRAHFGAMLEVCEHSDEVVELFSRIKENCTNWDGSEPFRALSDLA
jgi:hypothetical protein